MWKHEYLLHGALEGLGYKCAAVPTPNVEAFQLGKEYANNGQCNPTYFTVGNLVQHLQALEERGLSRQEIIDNYVFFTAGACGFFLLVLCEPKSTLSPPRPSSA